MNALEGMGVEALRDVHLTGMSNEEAAWIMYGELAEVLVGILFVLVVMCQRARLNKVKPINRGGAMLGQSMSDIAELAVSINKADSEDDMHDIAARIRKRVVDLMADASGPRMATIVRQKTKIMPGAAGLGGIQMQNEAMKTAKMERIASLYATMARVPTRRREMYQRKIDELEEEVLSTATF